MKDYNELYMDVLDRVVDKFAWVLDSDEENLNIENGPHDLTFLLFKEENEEGVYNEDSRQYISTYFDEIGEIYSDMEASYGPISWNPFKDTMDFMVCIILYVGSEIISDIYTEAQKDFNKKMEDLTLSDLRFALKKICKYNTPGV